MATLKTPAGEPRNTPPIYIGGGVFRALNSPDDPETGNFGALRGNTFGAFREHFEERAAILEYEAGMARPEAEAIALADTIKHFQTETRPSKETEPLSSHSLENPTMLTVSETPGTSFEMPPAGPVAARCNRLIDLGTQESTFEGEVKRQRKILLSWELAELRTDGTPFQISRRFGLSLHENASLRKFLQAWRGRPFSETELTGFDLRKLLNAPAMLNIMHTSRNGKDYANIASISPLPKGMAAPDLSAPPVVFDIDSDDAGKVLETLSENLIETISNSPEWKQRLEHQALACEALSETISDDDLAF